MNDVLSSKLHLVCDGSGCPLHLGLTAGNRTDISQARQCLEPYVGKGCTVIADRGYDANHLRDWLTEAEAVACIPPRKNRKGAGRIRHQLIQNAQHHRAHVQSPERLAATQLAHLSLPGNVPRCGTHRCNCHLVLMSLRPRQS